MSEGLAGEGDWPPLQHVAERLVTRMTRHFASRGGKYLEYASRRWDGLFKPVTWVPTERLARDLRQRAEGAGRVETDLVAEAAAAGRVVWISVAPCRGDDLLHRGLGDYGQWLRCYRRMYRSVPDWGGLEFVHLMYLWDDDEVDFHMLYLFAPQAIRRIVGEQVERLQASGATQPFQVSIPPRIMPESIVSVAEFRAVMEEIEAEEQEAIDGG